MTEFKVHVDSIRCGNTKTFTGNKLRINKKHIVLQNQICYVRQCTYKRHCVDSTLSRDDVMKLSVI